MLGPNKSILIFQNLEKIRMTIYKNKKADVSTYIQALQEYLPDKKDLEEINLFCTTQKNEKLPLSEEEKVKIQNHLEKTVPNFNKSIYSPQVYTFLLPYAKLMYSAEQKGIAEEHAYKLSVVFENEIQALNYLNTQKDIADPMYNSCQFALPQGKFSLDVWRKLSGKFFEEKQFRDQILPQAADIEFLIRSLTKKQKVSPEAVKKATDEISKINVAFKKLRRHHAKLKPEEEKEYQNLLIQLSEKREALTQLGLPFSHNLTLVALEAFREKHAIMASKALEFFLNNGLTKKDYTKFVALERKDDPIKIPDIKLSGETIGHPNYYFMKIPVLDELHAARAACLGKLTKNCQSLSGEAGEPCVTHGLTSLFGGFYVLCKGDSENPKISDELVAQSWTWRSKKNAIVFDSIESPFFNNPDTFKVIKDFYTHVAYQLAVLGHTDKVAYGISGGGKVTDIGIPYLSSYEEFVDYNAKNDSSSQLVLFDKNYPDFYWYDVHQGSMTPTELMITQAMESSMPLMDNKILVAALNWAILANKDKLISKIKTLAEKYNRIKEIEAIIASTKFYYTSNPKDINKILSLIEEKTLYINSVNANLQTPLMLALNSNSDIALKLIAKGADINLRTNKGETMLMLAAMSGYKDVVLNLLENGADINAKGDFATALFIAILHKKNEVVKILIEKGADININFPPNYLTALMLAIQTNQSDIALQFIEKGADIHAKAANGMTALFFAAQYGLLDVAQKLIEKNADVTIKSSLKMTPLSMAAKFNHSQLILEFLKKDNDIEIKDDDGNTPLTLAIINKAPAAALTLIEKGANVNCLDNEGTSLLFLAIKHKLFDVCKALIAKSVKINVKDKYGNTPLMLVIKNKFPMEIILKLIEESDINAKNLDNDTALMNSLETSQLEIAQKLMAKGADVNITNLFGSTPLTYAIQENFSELIPELIEKSNVNVKTSTGRTPLMLAAQYNHIDYAKKLIAKGADINAKNDFGETAKMIAAKAGHEEFISAINQKYSEGRSKSLTTLYANTKEPKMPLALEQMIADDNTEGLKELLETMDPNSFFTINQQNRTLLMHACEKSALKVVTMLIEQGANVNKMDANDDRAVSYAIRSNNPAILNLLVKHNAILDYKNKDNKTPSELAAGNTAMQNLLKPKPTFLL
ncbi:MAG: ankyrin repeat domain-containing protein [Proteobacteria bacterium]|nr:ankyrin repeat domain-containing protein [Pseudomonadota bacterium]